MAIFPKIQCDDIVQVNDKFRIDASNSYVSKGEPAITLVEIQPEAAAAFIPVQGSPILNKNFYLDWEYSTAGSKVISLKITTSGAPITITKTVTAVTEADDKLFSDDKDILAIESNLIKYLPEGRSSFKYIHREAQGEVLEWLYTNGYYAYDGSKITKDEILDITEVNYWSKYLALKLIFEDLSKAVDDTFSVKAKGYENDVSDWRKKAKIKLDLDKDTVQGEFEAIETISRNLIRE